VNCVSHTVVENLKQFALKGDKSTVVRRTFWPIKVVPTWKKFGKRCITVFYKRDNFYVTVLLPSVESMWATKSVTDNKQDFDVESLWENQWIHCDVSASMYVNVFYLDLGQVCILFRLLMNQQSYVILAGQWPKPQEVLMKQFSSPLAYHLKEISWNWWCNFHMNLYHQGSCNRWALNLADLFSYLSVILKAT
jgi:hypothetical protein